MDAPYPMSAAQQSAASALAADLQRVFGSTPARAGRVRPRRTRSVASHARAGRRGQICRSVCLRAISPSMAPRRPRRPAAPRAERVRAIARRLPRRVRRNRRQPHHHHRTRSVRRRAHRGGRPAPVVRAAGEEPSDSLARGFSGGRRGSERNGLPDRIVLARVQSAAGQHRSPRSRAGQTGRTGVR